MLGFVGPGKSRYRTCGVLELHFYGKCCRFKRSMQHHLV